MGVPRLSWVCLLCFQATVSTVTGSDTMSSLLTRVLLLLLFILEDLQTTGASCDCSASTCRCGGLSLTTIPQDLPTSITSLYMEYNNITELRMPDFSRYRNLSSLSLPDNHLFVIRSRAFYHLTNLTSIDLRWNKLTSLKADTFVGLGGLQALNLDYNNISSIDEGTFSETPKLVHLLLGSNRLTSISPGSFTGLNQLQLLDLFSNQITYIQPGTFSNLPQLKHLYLYQNRITNIHQHSFSNLPQLQLLSLFSNKITEIRLGTFTDLPRLQELDLDFNHITNIQSGAFSNLSQLEYLGLGHNQMKVPLLTTICHELSSVPTLILTNNPWQCDCRIVSLNLQDQTCQSCPREIMDQIICTEPAKFRTQKLKDINVADLNCTETSKANSATSASHLQHSPNMLTLYLLLSVLALLLET
ncbi:PREDICTED: leucine-rich repeat-containing protein 15-like [Branchiostoma belcheri]|uniref:Leucine-rich repeat-containing protein 15-like n=1 Tax=Branchiostoma belcheri TaxID=7741 RepID=A0A6P4ZMW7_BRABE|nr:PREDICTED: leucine-rich repeat-containing protein 15-like [Branchiostoma belcheri]